MEVQLLVVEVQVQILVVLKLVVLQQVGQLQGYMRHMDLEQRVGLVLDYTQHMDLV